MSTTSWATFSSLTSFRIQNPLAGFSEKTLLADVKEFAEEHELLDILPLLQKGALVARNPANYENVTSLDDADREALHHEATHRWSHPIRLYVCPPAPGLIRK